MKPRAQADTVVEPRQAPRPNSGELVEHVIIRRSRCVDRELAAQYLGTSPDTVERLINAGELPIVKLPVSNANNGNGQAASRRVLIDVRDLDELIARSKERRR